MTDKEKIQNRLPDISPDKVKELSDEQVEFIVLPLNKSCYLKACPGSGKTEVVGLKSTYEITDWKEKYNGIAVLSFTRNAAKEISDRVSKYNGINSTKYPHFVGTIDSWLHKYILHPFGHKVVNYKGNEGDKSFHLVDNQDKYYFLNPFKTDIFENGLFVKSIFVNEYYFECNEKLTIQSQSRYFNCDKISEVQKKLLLENKYKFLKSGLTTYSDAEFLCYYVLLRNKSILSNLVKRFPYIFIDECQDLSYNQLQIFQLLHNEGVKLFFIGDINQAIYEFRKVYIDNIEDFIKINSFTQKILSRNFRSNQQIVDVCQNIENKIIGKKNIYKIKGNELINNKNIYLWEYNNTLELPKRFIDFIEKEYNKDNIIKIKKLAILGRGYSLLSEIRPNPKSQFDKIELFANALTCWNTQNRTGKDMQNALQQLGKSISLLAFKGYGNHQQQYCPEGVTSLEWRGFLFKLIKDASNKLYPFNDKTWSEWVTKHLKPFLKNNWNILFNGQFKWEETEDKVKSPIGRAKYKISDDINSNSSENSDKIRITTIHDVKGENLDAVMLVSTNDKKSKGGHFEHWISDLPEEKEFVRFAYVASSRPKHLLVWAVPKISKIEIDKLNRILNL